MQKRWNILDCDTEIVSSLTQSLNINRILCTILQQRGINTFEEAKNFFRPDIKMLHSPWLMKDMEIAVERILEAIQRDERILIFGDYDVDGTTSVAAMYQFICSIYDQSKVDYYIPHRYREGYGVSKAGIEFAKETNCSLIISLDCGIKSIELIRFACTLGIDFIVCDHHLPDNDLPPAVAILNPKQSDCNYPYKELCGCGVGFKLMSAISEKLKLPENYYYKYLDLVATAIAADIVPMTGENRILAYYGLKKINEDPCPGIKAIIQLSDLKSNLSITNVVFVIAPRVNAAGRMDDAKKAVQLFIEKDEEAALKLAEILNTDNTDRKTADVFITKEALEIISSSPDMLNRKSSVVYMEHWHKGVVGIVASRLIEHYYRPTVVLTRSGDMVSGSARSVSGYNLYEAIHACRDHLVAYGGHFAAAGLSLLPENVEIFRNRFDEVVSSTIDPSLLIPEVIIDSELNFRDITNSFYRIISQMEPFGPGNVKPVFIARNVKDSGYSKVVKGEHVRLVVSQEGITLTGIGFFLKETFEKINISQPFDIVFTLDQNEWNGSTTLQLKILDLREPQIIN